MSAAAAPTILLGPAGTVRDLVGAVLTLQGFAVETVERLDLAFRPTVSGIDIDIDTDTETDGQPVPVLVLVAPGVEEWEQARRFGAGVVLVAESNLGPDQVIEAILRGADAVCHTDASPLELARAVDTVRDGATVIDPLQARRLAAAARSGFASSQEELRLTTRELEILLSVERGESVKQTARSLGIAAKTVENLQSRLFRKLGARNRAHAVTLAHRLGLLEPAAAAS